MFFEKTLPSGLRIVGQKLPHFRSVSLGCWIGTGSVKEQDNESGISHFIEHMLFKGTKSRSAQEIAVEMDAIGAQLNAFTSKECTCFYAKFMDEHIEKAADVLSDMVKNSAFDPAEIEKEKGVVIEEINMVEDMPEDVVMEMLSSTFFGDDPYGKPILGTRESVRSFTDTGIRDYMKRHYDSKNTIVAVAGNFDEQELSELVEQYFDAEPTTESAAAYPVAKVPTGVRAAVRDMDIEQCHLALALPSVSPLDELYYPQMVLNNALGGSMSSRLFQKIREDRGLAYSVYSFNSAYKDMGTFGVYAGTGGNQGEEVLKLILDELDDVRAHSISQEEFVRSKEQLKGSYILANESVGARMNSIGKNLLLHDRLRTEEEVVQSIESVTYEQVSRFAAEYLVNDNLAGAFVGRKCKLDEVLISTAK